MNIEEYDALINERKNLYIRLNEIDKILEQLEAEGNDRLENEL